MDSIEEIEIINVIDNFLLSAEPETITPSTLVFQVVNYFGSLQSYNTLEKVIKSGIDVALMKISNDSIRTTNIYKASHHLRQGYDSVESLYKIGALKRNEVSKESDNSIQIYQNFKELQRKLSSPISDVDTELCDAVLACLPYIDLSNVDWRNPIASQVLEENSSIFKKLDDTSLKQFLEPKLRLLPNINEEIRTKCIRFSNENAKILDSSLYEPNLLHDSTWKEAISRQKKVTDDVLQVLVSLIYFSICGDK